MAFYGVQRECDDTLLHLLYGRAAPPHPAE